MDPARCVALVTGAGSARGLGRAFVDELCRRQAKKVYATDLQRPLISVESQDVTPGVVPLELDVASADQVQRVANQCRDVNLLINNAGVCFHSQLIRAPDLDAARREMEVNFWGMLMMCRAFAPILRSNGGGAIVIISSVAALVNHPYLGSYSVSKAASASMIEGVRAELAAQGTHVIGVYPGTIDTDMSASNPTGYRVPPVALVQEVFKALETETDSVIYGNDAVDLVRRLSLDRKSVEQECAARMKERLAAAEMKLG